MAEKIVSVKINVEDQSLEQLENSLQDVNAEILKVEQTSSKFTLEDKIQAADGAIKVMAGSLQTVVGALGVLGVESEAFGEFEKKAASVIAFSLGLKDATEGVGKLAIAYRDAGGAAAIFGKVTKRALISTGIGAFVVALGLIVAYWDDIVKFVKGSTKELKEQNRVLDIQRDRLGESRGILEDKKELLALEGKSLKDINTQLKKNLEAELSNLETKLQNLQTTLLIQQEEAKSVSNWEKLGIFIKNFGNTQAALIETSLRQAGITDETKDTTEQIKQINESILETKKGIATITKEEVASTNELKDKEQARLDAFRAVLEGYVTGLEDLKADSDQKILDLEKERARKAIDVLELETDEKKKVLEAFEKYFEQKQKDLTKIQLEEAKKRNKDQLDASLTLNEELFNVRMRQLEALAETLDDQENILNNYRDKELADSKSAEADKLAVLKESYDQLRKDQQNNIFALLALDKQYEIDKTAIKETGVRERSAINKEYATLLAQLAAEDKIREKELQEFKVSVAANAAMALSEALTTVFAQSKEVAIAGVVIEKAAAIAQIVAATAVANAKMVALFPVTLGQPWVGINTAAAGLSIATTVAQAAQAITKINNPSNAGGGTSLSGVSGGNAPSTSSTGNANQPAPIPQVDQASACMRTYVLAGDVTSDQEANAKLSRKRNIA